MRFRALAIDNWVLPFCQSGVTLAGMKTLTMKVPDGLLAWLEGEAKRVGRPKSSLAREILQQQRQRKPQSALALAADLCGCAQSGLGNLARNKKHLRGFGR